MHFRKVWDWLQMRCSLQLSMQDPRSGKGRMLQVKNRMEAERRQKYAVTVSTQFLIR